MSAGARIMLEQFLCALCQEGMHRAFAVMQNGKVHKRMPPACVKLGFDATFESVFKNSGPAPANVLVLPHKKVPKKKKEGNGKRAADGDEEFEPVAEEPAAEEGQ